MQVGVSGFRIDLGVRHPDHPDRFLIGIECDGARYHSSKSARDRDRLREEVLQGPGWELLRIWSTDWFDDPNHQTERCARVRARIHARVHDEIALICRMHGLECAVERQETDAAKAEAFQRAPRWYKRRQRELGRIGKANELGNKALARDALERLTCIPWIPAALEQEVARSQATGSTVTESFDSLKKRYARRARPGPVGCSIALAHAVQGLQTLASGYAPNLAWTRRNVPSDLTRFIREVLDAAGIEHPREDNACHPGRLPSSNSSTNHWSRCDMERIFLLAQGRGCVDPARMPIMPTGSCPPAKTNAGSQCSKSAMLTSVALKEDAQRRVPRLRDLDDRALSLYLRERGCTRSKTSAARGWTFPPLAGMRDDWAKRYGGWTWDNSGQQEWEEENMAGMSGPHAHRRRPGAPAA